MKAPTTTNPTQTITTHHQNFHYLVHKFRQIFAYHANPSMHLPTTHYILLASISLLAVTQAAPAPQPQMPTRPAPPVPIAHTEAPTVMTDTQQPVCIDGGQYLTYTPYECMLTCADVPDQKMKGVCEHVKAEAPEVGFSGWECNCSHEL